MTDPPMIGDVALASRAASDAPLVVDQPGRLPRDRRRARSGSTNPLVIGLLGVLTRLYLERADPVVAIGETMKQRLEHKGARPERVRVIPNWVDTRRSSRAAQGTRGRASTASATGSS